jgi:hypothetical protein
VEAQRLRPQLPYPIVIWIALALASCGKSEAGDDAEDGDGAGAPERGGAGPSGGSGGGGAGSGSGGAQAGSGGSGGAQAGSGGSDCTPQTCTSVEDCTPVAPEAALITDFSMLYDGNIFHSESPEWWLEFFGGPYIYPSLDECATTQPDPHLEQAFDGGTWHITGTVATYAGAGLWVAPCNIDMSEYSGISFTISGNVGPTGSILVSVATAANNFASTDPLHPSCHPNEVRCVPADPENPYTSCASNLVTVSDIDETTRTVSIPWEDFTGGIPEATVNPAEVRGIGLVLDWQFAYTAADAYPVDFTIDDVLLTE